MKDMVVLMTVMIAFIAPLMLGAALLFNHDIRRRMQPMQAGATVPRPAGNVGRFLCVFGCVLLVVGVFLAWHALPLVSSGGRTTGVVERYESSGRRASARTYAPVVQFSFEGKDVRFRSFISSSPPTHAIGERVPVRFVISHPERAVIDVWYILYAPFLFPFLGLVMIIVGIVLLRKTE